MGLVGLGWLLACCWFVVGCWLLGWVGVGRLLVWVGGWVGGLVGGLVGWLVGLAGFVDLVLRCLHRHNVCSLCEIDVSVIGKAWYGGQRAFGGFLSGETAFKICETASCSQNWCWNSASLFLGWPISRRSINQTLSLLMT